MKEKYKNIWKRSEIRQLIKNILLYGDNWNIISQKTGNRKELKYQKYAKRYFIKNSFILHRIYENQNIITIDNFFEFKNNLLLLNFSNRKLKLKDFKITDLKKITFNFYKNLKSLGIENSYFDEHYVRINYSEMESEQTKINNSAIDENNHFNNNDHFNNNLNLGNFDNNSENYFYNNYSKSNVNLNFQSLNRINNNLSNSQLQNSNMYFEKNNFNKLNFENNFHCDYFRNKNNNFNFDNIINFKNDLNVQNNNYENSNIIYFNDLNYSNKNLEEEFNEQIINHLNSDSFKKDAAKNFNLELNEEKIYKTNKEINTDNSFTRKIKKDYNMISLRILKRFNSNIFHNFNNYIENSQNEFLNKHYFYIQKVHSKNKCIHNLNLKVNNIEITKNSNEFSNNTFLNKYSRERLMNIYNNNNKNNNNLKEMEMKDQTDENLDLKEKILEKDNLSIIENDDSNKNIENNKNSNDNKNLTTEFNMENLIKNDIIFNEYQSENLIRKTSDIFKFDKDYSKKKLSMNSIITQISNSQNNINNENLNNIFPKYDDLKERDNLINNDTINQKVNEKENNLISTEKATKNEKDSKSNLFVKKKRKRNNLNPVNDELTKNLKQLDNQNENQIDNFNNKENFISNENQTESLKDLINKNNNFLSSDINSSPNKRRVSNTNPTKIKKRNDNKPNDDKTKNKLCLYKNVIQNEKDNEEFDNKPNSSYDSFDQNKIFDIRKIGKKYFMNNNINNNFDQFEKELNIPTAKINNQEKLEVEETLSSDHSDDETKKNLSSKNADNFGFYKNNYLLFQNFQNKDMNYLNINKNLILPNNHELKNDMLDFQKNYQLNQENSSNNNNDPYFNINSNFNNSAQSNFFQNLSVLWDKNNNSDFNFNKNKNSANTYNKINTDFNLYSNPNYNFNNKIGFDNFDTNVNNNNIQNVNLNDFCYNFNSKITPGPNNELNSNFKNEKYSRKNSKINNEINKTKNKNEFINENKNLSNHYSSKNVQRKNNSFTITKNYNIENKQKFKEIPVSTLIENNLDLNQDEDEKLECNNNKLVFIIEKFTKEEKEKLRELEMQKFEANSENENLKNQSEEDFYCEDDYISYNTEFFEKANYNDSTIKALISLRKLNRKKTSVDLTTSNINKNNIEERIENEKETQNENISNSDIIENNENNKTRKLSYLITKERKRFSMNSENIVGLNENQTVNNCNEEISNFVEKKSGDSIGVTKNNSTTIMQKNSSDFNLGRKESSFQGENNRKNSFLITKETRRKDTILTNNGNNSNINKKLSIDDNHNSRIIDLDNNINNVNLTNHSDLQENNEYNNLKPVKNNGIASSNNNYSINYDKVLASKKNFKTIKEGIPLLTNNHSLITNELDIDTIKSLRSNIPKIQNKNIKQLNQNSFNAKINNNNTNNNIKDSQIFTNFNSYILNLENKNNYSNNNMNQNNNLFNNNNNIVMDFNQINDVSQIFSKEKNSHYSYDNNFTREALNFSEFNEDLEICMNSSNSAESQKKKKILDDKVEKLISSVIQKQQKTNLLNKKSINNNKIFTNNCNNNFSNNFNNNNNIYNSKDASFNVNNFTYVHSNKIYKDNSENNSINLTNNPNQVNFDNFNILGGSIKNSNNINPNNFYSGPTSITTNNINNFHIINSNGPCIFPITQNITNYGNIVNNQINPYQNVSKGNFKIQNENFNIITEDNQINNSEQCFNLNNQKNQKKEEKFKKSFINSDNDISKNSININKDKFSISNSNNFKGNEFVGNLNIKKDINKVNNISKICNLSDLNLGNFNDDKNSKRTQYNFNNSNNALIESYENLKIFDDKNNFIQDKIMSTNYNKQNNMNSVFNNCNNYYINNRTLITNPGQSNGLNSLNPSNENNSIITLNNPNQCKEDFNYSDPFDINFHIDNKIDDLANVNNKIDNNDDIFDMLGFN